ncbi:hypothetical protein GON22_22615 [Paenibacillus sp. MMS18-CY102]|nr:hypothetical protein [Paenibacillus sp. MMS18-CY102]
MKGLLSLIVLAILLTGCSNASSIGQQAAAMDPVLKQRYADLGHIAGFKDGKPSIYTTLWTLKTLNKLDIKIPHKSEIIDWMNSVELVQPVHSTDKANTEWLEGVPPEYALIFQLEIYNELESNVPTRYQQNIDSHFKARQQSDGSFISDDEIKDPLISTLWAIRIYDLLKMEIPNKKKVLHYINNEYSALDSDMSKINHVYYLIMLKETIPEELLIQFKDVIKGLSTDIFDSKDLFRNTHMWYQIKMISSTVPVDININITEDKLLYSFDQYFSGEGTSLEILYKYSVIFKGRINEKEKEKLESNFESTYFNNGWNSLEGIINENTTMYGLFIARELSQINELNLSGIKNYYSSLLTQIENSDSFNTFLDLKFRIISKSIIVLGDKELINNAKRYLLSRIKLLSGEEINILSITALFESAKILGVQLGQYEGSESSKSLFNQYKLDNINEINIEQLYQYFVLQYYLGSHVDSDIIKESVLQYIHPKGGFKFNSYDNSPSLEATYVASKIIRYFKLEDLLSKELVSLDNFLNEQLTLIKDESNAFFLRGLIYMSKGNIDSDERSRGHNEK